jgi:hypothetical protein
VTATVKRLGDGVLLPVTKVKESELGFGDHAFVFSHADSGKQSAPSQGTETYRVTVNFVTSASQPAQRVYDVIVYDVANPPVASSTIPSTPPPVCSCPNRGLKLASKPKKYNVKFNVDCNTGYRFRYCLTRNSSASGFLRIKLLFKPDDVFVERHSENVGAGVRAQVPALL